MTKKETPINKDLNTKTKAKKDDKNQRQIKSNENLKDFSITNEKDLQTLIHKTGFSRAEILQKYGIFATLTATNYLDQRGFVEFYATGLRREPRHCLEKISNLIFLSLDRNKRGYLTFPEIMSFYATTIRGEPNKKLEQAFALYDLENKGIINGKDIYKVISAMLDLLDADKENNDAVDYTDECMNALDMNRTGHINRNDFVNGLLRNFSLRVLMSPYH